jgi:hypothetical protein
MCGSCGCGCYRQGSFWVCPKCGALYPGGFAHSHVRIEPMGGVVITFDNQRTELMTKEQARQLLDNLATVLNLYPSE